MPVFRWTGATARYSCFSVPVETGTPPYIPPVGGEDTLSSPGAGLLR